MASRKKKGGGHGEHENSERWLLTYADMITLLVAFFIMLYAMSIMNQQKFQQLAISVRSGFGGALTNSGKSIMTNGGGPEGAPSIVQNSKPGAAPQLKETVRAQMGQKLPVPPADAETLRKAAEADAAGLDKAMQTMQAYIKAHKLQNSVQVTHDERGIVVAVMTDKMLFAKGDAALRPQEGPLLSAVARVVNTVPNYVRIEGHTDNLPIRTARFPSNWELSSARASSVVQFFLARGVPAERVQGAFYADRRPLAANDTEANRARNRRVEIVILRRF